MRNAIIVRRDNGISYFLANIFTVVINVLLVKRDLVVTFER
jgi:hypothetical protein